MNRLGTLACLMLVVATPVAGQGVLALGFFGGSQVSVARVDPATGAPTILVTTSATAISGAQAALDPARQRLYFYDGSRLYTVNIAANTFSVVTPPACCSNLLFDVGTGQLLAIGFFGSSQVSVAVMDPATGTATAILVTTTATGISGADIAYDATRRRVYFQDGSRLFTVDLMAGAASSVTSSNCCPKLLFDTATGQLLGLGFGGGDVKVATIDPSTSVATVLFGTGATALSGSQATIDVAARRIYFQDGTRLITANLAASLATQTTYASCCTPLFAGSASPAIPTVDTLTSLGIVVALALVGLMVISRAP